MGHRGLLFQQTLETILEFVDFVVSGDGHILLLPCSLPHSLFNSSFLTYRVSFFFFSVKNRHELNFAKTPKKTPEEEESRCQK